MTNKLDEIKDSVLDTLKSRFGDPIVGSYFLSFVIINWEILIYLFSSTEASEKVEIIRKIVTPDLPNFSWNNINFYYSIVSHPLALPLYATLTYLFIFPIVTKKARKIIIMNKVESENDRFEAEGKLSPIQAKITSLEDRIAREIQLVNNLNDLKSSNEETIRLLKTENTELQNQLNSFQRKNEELPEVIIAKDLADKNIAETFKSFSNIVASNYVWVGREAANKFAKSIPIFVSHELIERERNGTSDIWKLTELGKRVLTKI